MKGHLVMENINFLLRWILFILLEKSADSTAEENSGERFANNSLGVPMTVFLSYFLSDNFTLYINTQQYDLFDLGNKFTQNYILLVFGGKYQLSDSLNLELS